MHAASEDVGGPLTYVKFTLTESDCLIWETTCLTRRQVLVLEMEVRLTDRK